MIPPLTRRQIHGVDPIKDDCLEHTRSLVGLPKGIEKLSFYREKNAHRGLREFQNLKELIIYSPSQEAIEEVSHLGNLEFLYINQCRAKEFSSLVNCRNLRNLTIIGATQVTDLSWIVEFLNLRALAIENLKKVSDLSILGSLTDLKTLGVEGIIWSTQKVDSFQPLSEL